MASGLNSILNTCLPVSIPFTFTKSRNATHPISNPPDLISIPRAPDIITERLLAFSRPGLFACMVNISAAPVPLPPDAEVLLASGELDDGKLPPDTAAWLRTSEGSSAGR